MAIDHVVNERLGRIEPRFTLCHETGVLAAEGMCPTHASDACLAEFIPHGEAVECAGQLVSLARDEGWPPPDGILT